MLREWQDDPVIQYILSGWLKKFTIPYLLVLILTGSFANTLKFFNSNFIGSPIFSMHLPKKYLHKVVPFRLIDTVLLENIPQLIVQILFFLENGFENEIVLVAFFSSTLSLSISTLQSLFFTFNNNFQVNLEDDVFALELKHENIQLLALQALSLCQTFGNALGGDAQVDYIFTVRSLNKTMRLVFLVSRQVTENIVPAVMQVHQSGKLESSFRERFGELEILSFEHVENKAAFSPVSTLSFNGQSGLSQDAKEFREAIELQ